VIALPAAGAVTFHAYVSAAEPVLPVASSFATLPR
jgi:hypothetical protein